MGNIIVTGEVDIKKEPTKVKMKIPFRTVEFEVPDDLKEGAEQKMFIDIKKKQEILVWYLAPFGVEFKMDEAMDAVDFSYQIEQLPFDVAGEDDGIDEEHAELMMSILEWDKMSVGQKMFVCLTFPEKMLSQYLFSEQDKRITKLIQNRFGSVHSNLILF